MSRKRKVSLPGHAGGGGLPFGGVRGGAAELVKHCLVAAGRKEINRGD